MTSLVISTHTHTHTHTQTVMLRILRDGVIYRSEMPEEIDNNWEIKPLFL